MSMELLGFCDRLGEKGFHDAAGILRRTVLQLEIDGKIPKFLNLPEGTPRVRTSKPEIKEPVQDSAEIMAKGRADESPYLDPKKLRKIEREYVGKARVRGAIEYAIDDIKSNGDEAISHLCLSARSKTGMRKAGLGTISELELFVENDTFLRLRHVGLKCDKEIGDKLQQFREMRQEYQNRQNQRTSGYVEGIL